MSCTYLYQIYSVSNIDSGNGLVLSGTKPLIEPLLATNHQWSPMSFIFVESLQKKLEKLTTKQLINLL